MFEIVSAVLGFNPFITILVFALCLFFTREYQRTRGLPPGPYGLPWIGYAFKLNVNRRSRAFAKLCEDYKTDILSVTVFGRQFVVLNTLELIKEVYQKRTDAVDRIDDLSLFRIINPRFTGIINTSGRPWKEVRRFSISTLRDFGMGRVGAEEQIQAESRILCDEIKKHQGKPFDPQSSINIAVSNIICGLVFGQRFEHCDKNFVKALDGMNRLVQRFTNITVFFLLQFRLARDFLIKDKFKEILNDYEDFGQFVRKRIQEHKDDFSGETTDLIYCYLKEMEEGRDPDVFTDDMLESLIIDFFIAGSETTYSTLRWGLLAMATNPEVQKKIHKELDEVVGDREPCMSDKKQTPYTEAALSEIQRFFTLVPLGVAHSNSDEDISIKDYRIPTESFIVANIDAVHNDKSFWKNPDEFDPNNFLDDGKVVNLERLVPFSIGRRACAGEALARMELYVFFTTLVKNFEIKLETDHTKPNMIGLDSGVYQPRPFKVRMKPRY